ncbi:MAG TPA: transglycosylase SLT domain-containing protein [Candidatus Xenobia bacterium]|jgi:hypothetical protein
MAMFGMNPMVGMAQMGLMSGVMMGEMMGRQQAMGGCQSPYGADSAQLSPAANSCMNSGQSTMMMLEMAMMLSMMMEMGGMGGGMGMGMGGGMGMGSPFGGMSPFGGFGGFGGGMPGAFPSFGGGTRPMHYGGARSSGSVTPSGSTDPQTLRQNAQLVARIAQQKGVDPTTAVATMLVESGGNNRSVGDHGTSFGLFQLHQGGELGNMSPQQAFDPGTNASTALNQFAATQRRTGLTGGALAAAAQRPANPQQYAAMVNSKMAEARALLGQ